MPKHDPELLDMRPKWREKRKVTILCMVSAVLFATFLLYLYVADTYTPEAKVEDLSSEEARVEAQVPVKDSKSSVPVLDDYNKEKGPVEDEKKETAPAEDKNGSKESVVEEKENQELNAKGDEEQEVEKDESQEDSAVKTEKQEDNTDAVENPTDEDELDETEDNKPDATPAEEKPAEEQKPSETETPVEKLADEQKTNGTDILAFADEVVNKTELELTVENKEVQTNAWASQVNESKEEKKEIGQGESQPYVGAKVPDTAPSTELKATADESTYNWKLCTFSNAADYIPCLDNQKAIKQLKSRRHYEHRERHCPTGDDIKKCLVPLPQGYQTHVNWPQSRKQVWYNNVPHPGLVSYKKDQNWVRKKDDLLIFPGGGTQFKQGAERYIEFIEISVPEIAWGKHTRTVLDVGCGVASFGGFLFDKDVLTMSLAPKDEHEAQVQLALERGIPAILAVMGTQRLVHPSNVYDLAHCARCRVPWHVNDGKLLLELNRLIRPGGYFVWSATPVYKNEQEDKDIWRETKALMDSMCWKMVKKQKDPRTGVGIAIFQKPLTDSCYEKRSKNYPPLCEDSDNPDAAWYVPMQSCLHKLPRDGARGTSWPQEWPQRLNATPSWLSGVPKGLFGKPASEEFQTDTVHWRNVVEKSYARGLEIDWTVIRNVMDMKAGYGGFAAALVGRPLWVMNVVPITEPDTLPIIFERGLIGQYHDWCESFSTYPRTYDLLHADHLFSRLKQSCGFVNTILEMDRILRPGGWGIFRDTTTILGEIEPLLKSLHWEIRVSYSQDQEQLIAAQKTSWRPES